MHVHCLGVMEERALSQYDSFAWEIVLKMLFFGDTGKDSALYSHFQVFQETELVE